MRVLEIGGGTGAAAREVAARIAPGHVLMIDRSATACAAAERTSADEIAAGVMRVRRTAIEEFELAEGEEPYDLAFACRVGALDGRHPETGALAMRRLAAALRPGSGLYVAGGDALRRREVPGFDPRWAGPR